MGKVQLFEIRLGDSRVVYSPGEPLAGTVTIRLAGSLQYRAIKVSCVGSCGVSNKINDTAWTVEEQYFNTTLSLADKGKRDRMGWAKPSQQMAIQLLLDNNSSLTLPVPWAEWVARRPSLAF
uniref:Arrestin-like N-terminal domain-containing protein n=1 Tax=Anolis carolinensis TaxID=28377 RepID=A0A803SPX9_ANOCA